MFIRGVTSCRCRRRPANLPHVFYDYPMVLLVMCTLWGLEFGPQSGNNRCRQKAERSYHHRFVGIVPTSAAQSALWYDSSMFPCARALDQDTNSESSRKSISGSVLGDQKQQYAPTPLSSPSRRPVSCATSLALLVLTLFSLDDRHGPPTVVPHALFIGSISE